MFTIVGKYNTATVMTQYGVDDATYAQILEMCNMEALQHERIVIMPDCHAGAGCTIGTTMTISNAVVPNFVGVDIGCGVLALLLDHLSEPLDFAKLDQVIRTYVPSGFQIRNTDTVLATPEDDALLQSLYCKDHVDLDRALYSLGTLGGGNHFIEVGQGASGISVLFIHTGSRYLGKQVAEYYQDMAYQDCKKSNLSQEIEALKQQGREREIESYIATHKRKKISKETAYLSGEHMAQYLHDMSICQRYAARNRAYIAQVICEGMNWRSHDRIDTIHNYIDMPQREEPVLRKGAVSAKPFERFFCPMNMRDGTLFCIGKGNKHWNQSAPHGAGRIMSRSEAKAKVTMQEFTASMTGIYTTSVCEVTIDESPMAYKPMEAITSVLEDTAEIVAVVKPVYNFKASDA